MYGALVSYTNLKPASPLIDNALYDDLLCRWDSRMLHVLSFGGAITIPKYSTVTVFLDKLYFQLWTLAGITLAMTYRETVRFWRFTAAWCVAFGLSIPVSIGFPSLGPAFYRPDMFAHIGNTKSAAVMHKLWGNYLLFQMDPYNAAIIGFNGIVAMPSLHIAVVYLSVIKLGKLFPRLRLVLWGLFLLFVIATVYLGWHYLLDGIAGVLLGWLAFKISTRWFCEKMGGDGSHDAQKSINVGKSHA